MIAAIGRGLAVVGFVFAVAAVALDDRRLAWAAIGVLTGALLLRLVGARRRGRDL